MSQSAIHARREILESVAKCPGVPLTHVAAALALDYKTTLYHARKLQRSGALVIRESGLRALYPPDVTPPPPSPPRRLADAVAAVRRGAGTPALLAKDLGVTRGSACSLLDAMERRGLVKRLGATSWRVATDAGQPLS